MGDDYGNNVSADLQGTIQWQRVRIVGWEGLWAVEQGMVGGISTLVGTDRP